MEAVIDRALAERCIRGDETAWSELVRRYQRLVYSVAHTYCSQPEDVSDVFQQVWMELYQHLSDLRDIQALPAWLITVTRRRSYAVLNSKLRSEPLNDGISDFSDPLKLIEREHTIERALGELSDRCRRLINLLYLDVNEPNYVEIAKQMGMPVSSIGPTRARCLKKLRKLIG